MYLGAVSLATRCRKVRKRESASEKKKKEQTIYARKIGGKRNKRHTASSCPGVQYRRIWPGGARAGSEWTPVR